MSAVFAPVLCYQEGWKYNKVQIAAEWSCLLFAMLHRPAVTSSGITLLTSPGAVSEPAALTCTGAGAGAVPGIRGESYPLHYSGDAG